MTQYRVEQYRVDGIERRWVERAACNDETFARSILHTFIAADMFGRKCTYRLRDSETGETLVTIGEQP